MQEAPQIPSAASRKLLMVDLCFITALLLLTAVDLVLLRGHPIVLSPVGSAAFFVIFFLLVGSWWLMSRRLAHAPRTVEIAGSFSLWRFSLLAALLFAVTLVCYYQPMKIHFWGGADDFIPLVRTDLWSVRYDDGQSRPLALLSHFVAQHLSAGNISVFLWYGVVIWFLNALLLFAILRNVMPRFTGVAVSAALLMVADRADPARFSPLWAGNVYCTAVFLLLLALWLLLLSYDRDSRMLLVAACVSIATALLMQESVFPLSMLGPILLWLKKGDRRKLFIWLCAWLGTVGVLALRFALFLLHVGKNSYQLGVAAGATTPGTALSLIKMHLAATLAYFSDFHSPASEWRWGILALLLAVLCFWWGIRRRPETGSLRVLLLGLAVAFGALLLGILPFLPVHGLFRTHFLAGPADAALVALALGLVTSFFPRRIGLGIFGGITAILVAHSTIASLQEQKEIDAGATVFFEKTSHIFEQIHDLCPQFPAETVVILVLDDNIPTPLGANYAVLNLGLKFLGAPIYQANYTAHELDYSVAFEKEGLAARTPKVGIRKAETTMYTYDKVVAFGLSQDGSVSLLEKLPPGLLPGPDVAAKYDPLALMKPAPAPSLSYLRCADWMEKLRDVQDTTRGVMLGAGWGSIEVTRDRLYRNAHDGARIAVNTMGENKRTLTLNVRPPKEHKGPWEFQAVDARGQVAASAVLTKHQDVRLDLPLDPKTINTFSLRLWETGQAADRHPEAGFRVYCRKLKNVPAHLLKSRDLAFRGVHLGANWYPLESYEGQTFRWIENDAQIQITPFVPEQADLFMTVEPGPGMGGSTCQLQLLDADGHSVAEATFDARKTVRLTLPKPLRRDVTYRLHVVGGGAPSSNGDPRILNFRVFDCVAKE